VVQVPYVKAQQNPLDRLKARFENGSIFHADFSQRYIDSYTQDTTLSKGLIWVGREKYKVHGNHQSIVVDGQTSMVYDELRNRVIISDYDPSEDDFAPSRMLNGADSTYSIGSQNNKGEGINVVLVSEDPFAVFKKVEIQMTSDLIPVYIKAIDQTDNHIITRFKDGSFVEEQPRMFNLDYPEGAEIIDMRN